MPPGYGIDEAATMEDAAAAKPKMQPSTGKSHAVRTYMFGLTTDGGPRLLAFRIGNLLIGRLPDNHFAINDKSVSRRHATLSVTPQGVFIEDMGSQNGTTVNGNGVRQKTGLRPGDILRIGHVPLYYFGFINPEEPPSAEFIDSAVNVTPMLPSLM